MPLNNQELATRLWSYRKQNWRGVQTAEWQRKIVEQQVLSDARPLLERILVRFGLSANKIRYLDIGSGIGDYVLAGRKLGIKSYGIEPDLIGVGSAETSLQIARDRVDNPRVFFSGVGEKLPFSDSQFHLITMNQVVEHVQDISAVLSEALRVLKPGGVLLVNCPNYLSFYEPHYKIFWFPLLPRFIAKIYLRSRGRDPKFLDGINYVTRNRLNGMLAKLSCDYEDEDISYLRERIAQPLQIRSRILRWSALVAHRLGVHRLAIWIYGNFYLRGLNYVVLKAPEA